MQLSDEVVAQIHDKFSRLNIEDAKRIIFEVTNELVSELKVRRKSLFLILVKKEINIFASPFIISVKGFRKVNKKALLKISIFFE